MPKFVVEAININNILECCRFGKDIILTEGQRIATDPVVIIMGIKPFARNSSLMVRPRKRRISSCS